MSKEYHQASTRRIQRDIKRRARHRKYSKKRIWLAFVLSEVKRVTGKIDRIEFEFNRLREFEKHFKLKEKSK